MSTRWGSVQTKKRTDKCISLDIRDLFKHVALGEKARYISLSINNSSKNCYGIAIIDKEDDKIQLYLNKHSSNIAEVVLLTTTKCNFGGDRHWFICPICYSRVAKLYWVGQRLGCRKCNNLTYYSCNISGNKLLVIDRTIEKILRKLNANNDFIFKAYFQIPLKTKHMHYKTYRRLTMDLREYQLKRVDSFISMYRSVYTK